MRSASVPRVSAFIALAGCLLSACEHPPTQPLTPKEAPPVSGGPAGAAYTVAALSCVADREPASVRCGPGAMPATGTLPDIIVGGQNIYVTLTSSGTAYNAGTGQFTFNTTLTNLIQQKLGTTDGTTLDPNGIRIFFESGPNATGGSGSVAVVPDGYGTFTATNQPFYQYNQIVAQNVVSSARGWTLIVPPTVTSFAFTVYVSAPVQFPVGYVDIQPIAPLVHPETATPLTFAIKSAVGNVLPGTVTWSSDNSAVATVASDGVITPLKGGSAVISGTDGTRTNGITVNVSGANRSWGGNVSTDFNTGGNWPLRGIVAVSSDTVTVPTGAANMPALAGATSLEGVVLQPSTSMNVGALDLTISKVVTMGSAAAITASTGKVIFTGAAGSVDGTLPSVQVTGTVTTTGNMNVSGTIKVVGGTLKNIGSTIKVQ